MCGLLGVANTYLTNVELGLFEKLLLVSQFRGVDATGVLAITKEHQNGKAQLLPTMVKDSMSSSEFLLEYRDDLDKIYKNRRPSIMMGHCRWATVGKRVPENAHPFANANIIGMHNGSIFGTFLNTAKFDTDSEALLYNIGELGLVPALQEIRNKQPAYALVWFDKKKGTLNFIKNKERPLWIGRNTTTGLLAWASEKEFLEFCLPRERLHVDVMFTLHDNCHLSMPMDRPNWTKDFDVVDISKEVAPTFTIKSAGSFPAISGSALASDFDQAIRGQYDDDYTDEESTKEPAPTVKELFPEQNDDHLWVLNYKMPKKDALALLEKGCSWCASPVKWLKRHDVFWLSEEEFVCVACGGSNNDVLSYIRSEQKKYWDNISEAWFEKHPDKRREGFVSERQKEKLERVIKPDSNLKGKLKTLKKKTKQDSYIIAGHRWIWKDGDWVMDQTYKKPEIPVKTEAKTEKKEEVKTQTNGGRPLLPPADGKTRVFNPSTRKWEEWPIKPGENRPTAPDLNDPPFDVEPTVH